MSRFAPSRASSPRRSCLKPPSVIAQDLLDNSRTSILSSVPELTGLAPDQVEFIDTVIQRASATATTFLSVFKAYNEILQERGLDPQHEVVYYGKLLKLGTLKGKNWGEKWERVKREQVDTRRPQPTRPPATRLQNPLARAKALTRLTGALKAIEGDDDVFSLNSHRDDTDLGASDAVAPSETSEADDTARNPLLLPRRSVSPTLTTNSLGLSTGPPASVYQSKVVTPAYVNRRPYPQRAPIAWDAESEATADTERTPSTVPPSYRAATRDPATQPKASYTPLRALAQAHSKGVSSNGVSSVHPVPDSARVAVQKARARSGSVINEDDAWKKIKMAQDETVADQFREDRLVERCWEVWKQGYQWIITTNEQIGQARENLIVRQALHRWRIVTAERRDVYRQVASLSDNRCLKTVFHAWRETLKQRQQIKWRQDMRARMKTVRDNHDRRLKEDVWSVWREKHRSNAADQAYSRRLVMRLYGRWKGKMDRLSSLDRAGNHLMKAREADQVKRCWGLWLRAVEIRKAEHTMAERVDLRILSNAVDTWKSRLQENKEADQRYEFFLVRRFFTAWKGAQDQLRTLDRKASKHVLRQNDVLVRAVWRVWKAHERGRLLDRVRNVRLMRQIWEKWQAQVREQREREDMAVAFSLRSSSVLASTSLQKWRQVYKSHRNAEAYAARYHALQLQYTTLNTWYMQRRARLLQMKAAKKAEKFILMRDSWKKWQEKLAEKRRERKLKEFEKGVLTRYLREWTRRCQAERQLKLLGDITEQRVNLRIVTNALNYWTTRVADLKFRELEVAQQSDREVLTAAFNKWKNLCIRHVEELSLMESYQDVKREENMRRMFYRWLAASRAARHKRLVLQEKEEKLKIRAIASAWDKWRGRYLDIRLQPMADAFLVKSQQNLVFRAFGIWHSKSTSLPAIRFHASHLKAKYWLIWRDYMPKALQAKKAREKDRTTVLSKALTKWLQAYKTRLELKAVARARYLRLPTSAPRQTGAPLPRTIPPPKDASAGDDEATIPARNSQEEEGVRPVVRPTATRPFPGRLGIASLLSERPRSPERLDRRSRPRPPASIASPSRPKLSTRAGTTRAPSPARSTTSFGGASRYSEPVSRLSALPSSGEVGRSQLWQELRGIQLKARPSTETARSKGLP